MKRYIIDPARRPACGVRHCPGDSILDPGGSGAAEEREDRRDRAAVRPMGAAGHAGEIRRRDRGRRDQRRRRHQVDGRRQARAGRDRRRRLGREGEERGAAPGRAGARCGRRHGRMALHLHARRHRSDRARRDPVAHALLRGLDHRPRLQIRVSVLADRGPAVGQRAADDHGPRQGRDRQGAGERRHHRRQYRLADGVPQADARRRPDQARHQDRDGRDLYAAALRRDAADPEGPLEPAGVPASSSPPPSPISSSGWRR